jgi:hypothetical protein
MRMHSMIEDTLHQEGMKKFQLIFDKTNGNAFLQSSLSGCFWINASSRSMKIKDLDSGCS